jgi:hypothetical protein
MRLSLLLVPAILLTLVSCNKTQKTEYNEDGTIKKKILYTSSDKSSYRELEYNAGKTIKSMYEFTNGIPDGRTFEYYPNGNIKSAFYYTMGRLNSVARYYDENGNLTDKGLFINDSMVVKEEVFYKDDMVRVNVFTNHAGNFSPAGSLLYNSNGLFGADNSDYYIVRSADSIPSGDSIKIFVDFIGHSAKGSKLSLSLGALNENLELVSKERTYNSDTVSVSFYYKPRKEGYNLILGKLNYTADKSTQSSKEYIFYHDFLVY